MVIRDGNIMSVRDLSAIPKSVLLKTWGRFALQLRVFTVSVSHTEVGTSGRQ